MYLLKLLKRLCCCLKNDVIEVNFTGNMTTNPINPNNFEAHQVYPYKKSFA
jgi:hypothetical protein